MTKNIFIAAHPRSGSTYLCHLMRQIDNMKVYLEIFHFNHDEIVNHLQGDYNEIKERLDLSSNQTEARTQIANNPISFIKVLEDKNKDKNIVFKVFPKHLPEIALTSTLIHSGLIIVLRRNLLHSYISNAIAVKTKTWSRSNTSTEKTEFSAIDFTNHVQKVVNFYRTIETIATENKKNIIHIDYETLASSPNPERILMNELSPFFKSKSKPKSEDMIQRQDSRSEAADKVSNPSEMLNFLRRFNLETLNSGLTSSQNIDYEKILTKI